MNVPRIFLLGTAALLLTGATAEAQEACSSYTVRAGDNLRRIASKAYGDGDLYRRIYDANVAVIGEKADLIEIGSVLTIPCAEPTAEAAPEGVTPVSTAAANATPTSATTVSATAETQPAPVTERPLAIVTGNGYAPFADKTLPGGGMMTQLVEMAIFRADPSIPYTISFVSDWQAHIDALLPSGAYDLSFPWIRPDCEGAATLSPGDQARCNDFAFSGPFYEIVDAFFATRDSGLMAATSYAEFEGKRICRPEGYTAGVLDAAGLTSGVVTLVRAENVKECFRALASGEVDLVSVDSEVGDSTVAKLGLIATIGQNPHLSSILSLHVIAHKSNPRAVAMLGALDAGMIEMYESGEWYDIVSTALNQQRQSE
ncbi:MAG: hypothetical protein ACK4IU_04220 [Tabrizicola flagellatus]|uniref:hypothetical protein n=1 Tax=Tabrizicola flagellatus TaxID=2593021 RepID=UPI00391890B9